MAKGATIYSVSLVVSKLLLLAIQVLLARLLGVSGYGLYNLGFSTLLLVQSFALLGLDQGVLRFGAMYRHRSNEESVKGTLVASLVLGVASGLIATALMFGASSAVSLHVFGEPKFAPFLQLFALALPFCIVAKITGAFAQSHHDIFRMTVIQQTSQPALNLLLVAGIFLHGGGLWRAAEAFVVSAAFSAAVGVYSIRRVFPPFFSSLRAHFRWSELLPYSLALSAVFVLFQVFWRAPSLLLGHLAGVSAVGLYSAAATLSSPPGFISLIFAQPFMPMMVDLYEQGSIRELDQLYRTVTRWTYMVVIPGFGFLVLLRRQFLGLFGHDFRGGASILVSLSLAWMIYYSKGPVAALLDMTGRQYVDLANLIGVVAMSLGLGFWLVPRAGAAGAGWALGVSILALAVAESVEAWIFFRILPLSRHFIQQILLAALAFSAGYLIQDSVAVLAQVAIVGGLYLLLSLLFGLDPADRNLLRQGWKGLAARRWISAQIGDGA